VKRPGTKAAAQVHVPGGENASCGVQDCFRFTGDSLLLDIKAIPGASKSQCVDLRENRLRIRIAAAPEDGKANGELRSFLAGLLDCPKRDIVLLSGEKSRLKTLAVPLSRLDKLKKIIRDL
jgi:uncharacterized protein (TIGR00251 family)